MFHPEKPEIPDLRADYANDADFCELLEREIKPLYLLAFLLTANHEEAQQCLAATAEEALKGQSVFRGWVLSWIKRTLIKNAIGIVFPASARGSEKRDFWTVGQKETRGEDEINALTNLPPLERFVFVMSILESYSPGECSVLLGCSTQKVAQSRVQALRRLSKPVALFPRVEARPSSFAEVVA